MTDIEQIVSRLCDEQMEALTAAHVQAARAENTRLREALIAIRQNAIERASKWKGMSAIDIAREALGDLP